MRIDGKNALIVALAITTGVLWLENLYLARAVKQWSTGYQEFVSHKVKGKSLAEHIIPESISIFRVQEDSIACAQLKTKIAR